MVDGGCGLEGYMEEKKRYTAEGYLKGYICRRAESGKFQ
jgi:hypothetical protein